MAINFIRFTETIKVKEEKRVVSVTLRPLIADCTGTIYFTDLQLQEGGRLTGYTPHTTTMLRNSANLPQEFPAVRYHNGVVRSGDTVIIFNLSGISPGAEHLDLGGAGLLHLPDSKHGSRKYITLTGRGFA